jgi:hypothetical protein
MIRLATRSDLNVIHELVMEFLTSTAYNKHTDSIDATHVKKLCYSVLLTSKIWLYEVEGIAVGLLMAVKEQNIWMPTKTSLRELVWYVKEQYRRSPGAGRLFIEFCREGEKLLNNGDIEGYFTTRMATTGDYDLSKRGFREVERLFLKD